MQRLQQAIFDVYALSLPRGYGFGDQTPVEAWVSEDHLSWATITRDERDLHFGILMMRRRVDHVWVQTHQEHGVSTIDAAREIRRALIEKGAGPEPMPPNTARRPALYDLENRNPGDLFSLLRQPTHHVAAWLLNQVYLALPKPDDNWVSDCQTANFHPRLWEAYLLACFREQGLFVHQQFYSPDFRIVNLTTEEAWVEAVTANPEIPYHHVNAAPVDPPADEKALLVGPAAVRFAKTLRSKLQRNYHQLPHVVGKPFAIALADFHAPGSMVWSREALISYLYGSYATVTEINGTRRATDVAIERLLGEQAIPAGPFRDPQYAHLSAVIFSNACTISKFNRVGVSGGALTPGLRYTRAGRLYDRTPGALEGIPFCLDVTSEKYRAFWPQGREPWCAELEVFHNPLADYPLPHSLLPEATHWFEAVDNAVHCASFYEASILWSRTFIQDHDAPRLTLDLFMPPEEPEI